MKRVLSRIMLASSVVLGFSLVSVSFAAEVAVPKPDAAKGEQLFTTGDPARGIVACVTCHGAAGNSTIPATPHPAAQPHQHPVRQLQTFCFKTGKAPPFRPRKH